MYNKNKFVFFFNELYFLFLKFKNNNNINQIFDRKFFPIKVDTH